MKTTTKRKTAKKKPTQKKPTPKPSTMWVTDDNDPETTKVLTKVHVMLRNANSKYSVLPHRSFKNNLTYLQGVREELMMSLTLLDKATETIVKSKAYIAQEKADAK